MMTLVREGFWIGRMFPVETSQHSLRLAVPTKASNAVPGISVGTLEMWEVSDLALETVWMVLQTM